MRVLRQGGRLIGIEGWLGGRREGSAAREESRKAGLDDWAADEWC